MNYFDNETKVSRISRVLQSKRRLEIAQSDNLRFCPRQVPVSWLRREKQSVKEDAFDPKLCICPFRYQNNPARADGDIVATMILHKQSLNCTLENEKVLYDLKGGDKRRPTLRPKDAKLSRLLRSHFGQPLHSKERILYDIRFHYVVTW